MDFRLTEDQRALKRGVRELLDRRFGRDALRAAVDGAGPAGAALDRELWRELGAAGFFALRLPEAAGGVGLGLPDAVLLFEEAGRALLPGPLIATHLAAGEVPGAAEGAVVVTAVDPSGLVEWLEAADVVLGRAEGVVPVRSVDPLTPLHRAPVSGGTTGTAETAETAETDPASREASLLTAAEQLGSAARTTELAVAHARTREQFGQPIGGFQAVKHLCAQMLVRTEVARVAVYAAAVTADPVEIAGARLLADEAATACARDCLQVYGGMGFTWEADVHLHLKRAWVRAERGLAGAAAEELVAASL
ncbi:MULTISPECIES: acyl-CoA dehydrogenase family protein [unclassified Streptomyces]|uniref:acyl-CoA dehydrogenase family protein n=1 Tax=unclassified Streptomyces TaxID=2593676 RepID=UPI002E3235FD|nr:acyl-CoA dehydrogenase family protein [Streptomyces sp. NBC_01268]